MQLSTADTTACHSRRHWEGVSGTTHTTHTHTQTVRATFDSLKFDTPVASVCKCVFATCDTKATRATSKDFVLCPRRGPFLYAALTWLVSVSLSLSPFLSVRLPVRLSLCLCVCRCPPCDLQLTATAAPASRKHFTLCEWTPLSHLLSLSLSLWFYALSPCTLSHLCMHQFLVISCYFVLYMYNLLDFVHFFLLLKICFYFSPSSSPSSLLGLVRRPVRPFGYWKGQTLSVKCPCPCPKV